MIWRSPGGTGPRWALIGSLVRSPEPAPAQAPEAVPVRRTRAWRRRVLAGAAALGVILAGGAALTLGSDSVETYETTVVR
ncbi:hypothetical protein [Nonomuraea sp. B1E8]|uniref:hypothetical protein n=1 Tax=unclassified Nonomuraea TaxID=2593643 RepID=UPI00325F7971